MSKILIIDDDPLVLHATRAVFESATDWEIWLANSGASGLFLAARKQPDAILLDVNMPEMDGFATLHHLLGNPLTESIPVILFTGTFGESERRKFAGLPIRGVIRKPFEAIDLLRQIHSFLDGRTGI